MSKSIILLFLIILTACSEPFGQKTMTGHSNSQRQLSESATTVAPTHSPVSYADPFIGTGGHGHTYPGATAPFGMVQLSPDTRLRGWDGCSGYHYSDEAIYGFSHTHLSGTGVEDYCDILMTPTRLGKEAFDADDNGEPNYLSAFRKSTEKASPGIYQVYLDEPEVQVELTAGLRYGQQIYQWEHTDQIDLALDLTHRDRVLATWLEWIDEYTVIGYRRSSSWAPDQHVYFATRFSRPVTSITLADGSLITKGQRVASTPALGDSRESQGLSEIKCVLAFAESGTQKLVIQTALSAVDEEGAKLNLSTAPDIHHPALAQQASTDQWREQLSKIEIHTTDQEVLTNFYSALYHASIAPNVFSDLDGRYRGLDDHIYQDEDYTRHTVYSLWDTYRAAHPLYTLLEPERVRSFVHDFWNMYKESGDMAMWELAGDETYCMIGYHAVPVIVDAYHKGLMDDDPKAMVRGMAAAARLERNQRSVFGAHGYLSAEHASSSVSQTLEYAYDDWCIASMATAEGMTDIAEEFFQRSQAWKQLLHPEDYMIRPKNRNFFIEPYDPKEVNYHYTEANGWQYNFYYPHDVYSMIDLQGETAYEAMLDTFFTTSSKMSGSHQADITGLIGQYAHGNEPSHHSAYLYHFLGKPHKSQELVHQILTELYTTMPDGICGNEDCGQMSAWYVLSALGMYPFQPADGNFLLVAPLVDSAIVSISKQHTLVIRRSGKGQYVQRVLWNDENLEQSYIHYSQLAQGGTLTYEMQSYPSDWGKPLAQRPPSRQVEYPIAAVPAIVSGTRSFWDSTQIELATIDQGRIYCTTDGSNPTSASTEYSGPISFTQSAVLRCIHINPAGQQSREMRTELKRNVERQEINLIHPYASQYSAGGPTALINGLEGGTDFRSGEWQGFREHDVDAYISLPAARRVDSVTVSFLQDQNSWVFLPTEVEVLYKADDGKFYKASSQSHSVDPLEDGAMKKTFRLSVGKVTDEIRLVGHNRGTCPEGHKAEGGKSWIFADEIRVE